VRLPSSSKVGRRSSRLSRAAEIPDSDEIEDVNQEDVAAKGAFQGVVVPGTGRTASRRSTRQTVNSTAPSSVADSLESTEYETPATSTVPTPTALETNPSKPSVGATARALELRSSAFALSGGRRNLRKRKMDYFKNDDSEAADENDDAQLAAQLQAEEYQVSDDNNSKATTKRRRGFIQDPVDLTESEDDMPLAKTRRAHLVIPRRTQTTHSPMVPGSESSELSSVTSGSVFGDDAAAENSDAAVENSDAMDFVSSALHDRLVTAAARGVISRFDRRGSADPAKRRAIRERARLESAHPEILVMWDELRAIEPIKPVPAEQPVGISRKLKPFQLEGLDWMIKQEKSRWKGGLLGDEMGMGKTIQAVSLIMSDFPAKNPTLVVVPPVALMQWQSEINDYTKGKLNVLVYHTSANPKCRLLTVKELKKYNVIMVSYSGLESMYRKENKGWSRNDGIVKEDSILHAIQYHRLILDEAHSIKQRTTSVARACFALKAKYKWCLSGTPVQNRIGEFFSLLRFLELMPFACYFCKECSCRELHWSQDEQKMCNTCKHSGFNHVSVFNQEILNPITQGEDTRLRKKGLDKLRLITDRIMLRRMKRDHTSSMELPPKDIIIHNEFFGEIERDFSQSIMSNSTRKFDTYVAQGVMLNNYANIFGLIMQMRQVANHPDLILRKNAEGGQNVLVCCVCDEPAEEAIRSRCHHEFCRECAKSYVRSFDGRDGDADCPRCHIPLVIDWDQPDLEQDEDNIKKSSIINRIRMDDWTSSTKIEMLVYDLYKLRSKKQTHKSIVFSQFTSMLQLVQWRLQKSGFSTVLLDGSMSPAQRQKSIDHFMNTVDVEVFLVSLKAGGVALNLTEASRVFIIDP